jgi:site-specific DNA recombinase
VHVESEQHSGADLHDREGLQRALTLIEDGGADMLLALATDRLSREQLHIGVILDRVLRVGASLQFVHEDFENSEVGKFILSARTFAAEMHLAKIREATQRGRRERVASGKPLAGSRPSYGYRWVDPGKSRLELEPVNASVVRSIFDMALDGRSLRGIAANLYERGIPSPTGSPRWTPAVIRDLLLRPVYSGHAVGYATRSERQPGGGYARRVSTAEERVPLPGVAPAIVTPQEAMTVAQRLTTNKAHATRNNRNPEAALLRAGYVKCGHCGWSMSVRNAPGGTSNRSAAYRCTSRTQQGHDCPQPTIATNLLDAAVWAKVADVLRDPQIIAREIARHRQDGGQERALAGLEKQIGSLADKQARIAKRVADIEDDAVAAPLIAELRSLAARKTAAEDELSTTERRIADRAAEDAKVQSLTAWCQRVGANLDRLNYNERRLALEALGVQVKVYSDRASDQNGETHPRWTMTLSSMR